MGDRIEYTDANGVMTHSIDTRTLAEVIDECCNRIDRQYADACAKSFPYGDKMIQMRYDPSSTPPLDDRKNISDMALAAMLAKITGGWSENFSWTTEDNTELPLPAPDAMLDLADAAVNYVTSLRKKQQAAKAVIRSYIDRPSTEFSIIEAINLNEVL